MSSAQRKELLAKTGLFGSLPSDELDVLAEGAVPRTYRKGSRVFHQGDPGHSLYVVVDGTFKVAVTSPLGDEFLLVTLERPDTFGELALVDGQPRSATVEALRTSVVLVITRDTFSRLAEDYPVLDKVLLRRLSELVRRLTDQASDFVFLDLQGRVAKLLCSMAEVHADASGPARELDLPLTQTDLARIVGGSRQSVNQIMRSFEARGLVELGPKRIVLLRLDELRRRAGLAG